MQTTQQPPREFKKVSVEILKLEPSESAEGTLKGKTTGPWTDKATGEERELTRLHFEREDGSKFIIFEDGGLRNAMANAMVKEGDFIRIVKGEKTPMGGGRTVNQYDIFAAN